MLFATPRALKNRTPPHWDADAPLRARARARAQRSKSKRRDVAAATATKRGARATSSAQPRWQRRACARDSAEIRVHERRARDRWQHVRGRARASACASAAHLSVADKQLAFFGILFSDSFRRAEFCCSQFWHRLLLRLNFQNSIEQIALEILRIVAQIKRRETNFLLFFSRGNVAEQFNRNKAIR